MNLYLFKQAPSPDYNDNRTSLWVKRYGVLQCYTIAATGQIYGSPTQFGRGNFISERLFWYFWLMPLRYVFFWIKGYDTTHIMWWYPTKRRLEKAWAKQERNNELDNV